MLVIYSKEKCQQCDSAKLLCQIKGVEFTVKMLDTDFVKEDLIHISPKARSFPVITLNNEYIGGLNSLQQLLNGDNL